MRQGDPLSPHLFNLVADGLSTMLKKATDSELLVGVTPHLIDGGLTHLQYADDTVLLIENSKQNIATLKFLLISIACHNTIWWKLIFCNGVL